MDAVLEDEKITDSVPHDAVKLAYNMREIAEKSQAIWQQFLTKNATSLRHPPALDPLGIADTYMNVWSRLLSEPAKLIDYQMNLARDYWQLMSYTGLRLLGEEGTPPVEADVRDKRFKDPAWKENAAFDFIKQSYLLTARWLQQIVGEVEGVDPHTARKLDFYTRQFVDALSPSNFLLTNPEALRATLESDGDNLVKGLENLLEDLEKSEGSLRISMSDENAFEIGVNLATTPGKVVFQNDLIQLIQYTPSTETVCKTPILMIPAWINKFYILDMQPDNSIVKWLVDQGHTVFVVSWANPDEKLAQKTFDDYMLEGPLAALKAIEEATGERRVSCVGYCLGGTLLAITQSWLAANGEAERVASATYLTTMIDFSEAGELSVFIDEEQLSSMEARMQEKGYLEGADMAMTFNMLRANDLIWSFVVNNYLLGKDPFPFDLLYWNADSTRMPARMHSYYLRNMYQRNLLAKPSGITVAGVPVDLSKVKTPSFIVSAREDHIAPWKSTYAATQIYGGPIRFVLAASGHIAGMVNPPARKKYSYWTNDALPASPDSWFDAAHEQPGSWWPEWQNFLKQHGGEQVPARKPGEGRLKAIENAPGAYVKVRT